MKKLFYKNKKCSEMLTLNFELEST